MRKAANADIQAFLEAPVRFCRSTGSPRDPPNRCWDICGPHLGRLAALSLSVPPLCSPHGFSCRLSCSFSAYRFEYSSTYLFKTDGAAANMFYTWNILGRLSEASGRFSGASGSFAGASGRFSEDRVQKIPGSTPWAGSPRRARFQQQQQRQDCCGLTMPKHANTFQNTSKRANTRQNTKQKHNK